MDRRKNPSSVDIQKVLLDMREYRMGLIQTPDQLRFSYMAVIEGAKLTLPECSAAQVAQGWGGNPVMTSGSSRAVMLAANLRYLRPDRRRPTSATVFHQIHCY